MLVRRETPRDHAAVRDVIAEAFAGDTRDGGVAEARLVDELRRDPSWLDPLSLVAEDGEGVIVGHVLCTRATIGDRPALGLGPLSVAVARQRCGVGSALVLAALDAAEALGEGLVVLVGHAEYYPRFGFVAAVELGIEPPDPAWGAAFQALPLRGYDPTLRGPFRFAPPFASVS